MSQVLFNVYQTDIKYIESKDITRIFYLQTTNSVYKFLSGVRVTPNTPFLLPTNSSYHQEILSSSPNASSRITTSHNINLTSRTNGESNPCYNTKSSRDDTQTVSEAYRYMHYAMGIYGWPMYLRQNTGMATCRLCSSLRLVKNHGQFEL